MDRYADGDDAAFDVLYEELSDRLYGYLVRLSGRRTEAEDLLQQVFLRIHDARGRFLAGADVEPWAFSIARRLFLDWRKRKREVLDGLEHERPTGVEADGEAILAARRLHEQLMSEVERLPPLQREAFLLVREEGLSMAQAAEVLGVSVAAVKLRAHRAYEGLRAALPPEEES